MLYREWMEEWLELYVKPCAKQRTYVKYRKNAQRYILPALGDWDLADLSPLKIQKFYASISGLGLADNTVYGIISVLRLSLKRCALLRFTGAELDGGTLRPKMKCSKADCLNKREQEKLERYIFEQKKPKLFGILLSLYTGLRIGELLALTWEDVDLARGTVAVTKSCHDSWGGGGYVKVIEDTKTRSSERVIPLPKKIIGYMKELKRNAEGEFVISGRTRYGAEVRTYQRTFGVVLKKLGIEHKGFHALRHTFATRAIEVGMDVKTLAELLGHRNPMVTLRVYTHSLMEHKNALMNKLARSLP